MKIDYSKYKIEEPEPIRVYNSKTNTEEIYFANGDILYKKSNGDNHDE